MKFFVKVKPGAKKEEIEKVDKNRFIIFVKEPPVKGMANEAVLRVLAEYFKVPKNQIRIIVGRFGREKIIEIGDKNLDPVRE